MNAADVVKAVTITPGTLVVFGDLRLDSTDDERDARLFRQLVDAIRQLVGHDQWLALRVHDGVAVGGYSAEEIVAALQRAPEQRAPEPQEAAPAQEVAP